MNRFERIYNLIAATITIVNLAYSVLGYPYIATNLTTFPEVPLSAAWVIFLVLEGTFGYFAEFCYTNSYKIQHVPIRIMVTALIILISAWTSVFNINWLLLLPVENSTKMILVGLIGALLSNLIVTLFIYNGHKSVQSTRPRPSRPRIGTKRTGSFGAIFLVHGLFMALSYFI